MNPWLQLLVTIASLLFGGGGLAVLVQAFTGRKNRKAEVADRLSDSSLKWVEQFQEETRAAWQELAQTRQELAGTRQDLASARQDIAAIRLELAECQRGAERLARDLRDIHGAIMAPNQTIDRLRALIGEGGATNGRY